MPDFKFDSHQQYLEWCEAVVSSIYYSRIAMNNERIGETVDEIGRMLHVAEGETLIKRED